MAADLRIFGTILLTVGPGLSARSRWLAWPPIFTSDSMNTRMPMPPNQWVKLRQKSIPLSSASTSVRMLAPVVVNPETVSNTASK